ncbi:uncharacterized protein B0I36DRAFT_327398 [Microdochium trichocladiopsis]|uniref:Uncharacterized protein n=1 Tax=Microdochium trichocladiopsis TaxID=1682393 RepID=A0A9P9BL05_9PEZI|nr:uncharacterized protein B0I36DRAFT_327398 [Microdochium trichocladiopsis]KAH7027577.1 hypothetical protein B0I36DRAFT_327398 [Microdochium trichocladiopsis]
MSLHTWIRPPGSPFGHLLHVPRWAAITAALGGSLVVVPVLWLRYWKRVFDLRTVTEGSVTRVTTRGKSELPWRVGEVLGHKGDGDSDCNNPNSGNDEAALSAGEAFTDVEYIVARERVVSHPIDVRSIRHEFRRKGYTTATTSDDNDDDNSIHIVSSSMHSDDPSSLFSPAELGEILDLDALVNAYLRTTMTLFAVYTPQAYAMRLHPAVRRHVGGRLRRGREIGTSGGSAGPTTAAAAAAAVSERYPGLDAEGEEVPARVTFTREYIAQCDFVPGDRVCGVYVVEQRRRTGSGIRVVLRLSPPGGKDEWKDAPSGVLDLGIEEVDHEGHDDDDDDDALTVHGGEESKDGGNQSEILMTAKTGRARKMRFVNETVLWRAKDERPVFLEAQLGRWMHSLMAAWFVVGGSEAVTVSSL